MDTYLKSPGWARNLVVILILIGLLIGVFPLLKPQNKADALSGINGAFLLTQGNSLLPNSNPNEPEPKVIKRITVVTTAYSSTVWETDDDPFTTAAGTQVRDGIVANNLLAFGTRIRLPEIYGDKIFVVEDRMSWKKGYYHVDIWFPSYFEAKSYGAKNTYIEILEN